MDHPLLAIGDFSELVGLSPRQLRSYAASGLLSPTAVDPASGYRFYAAAQVGRGQVIAALRRAGVPLATITAVLAAPDDETLDGLAASLDAELARRHEALDQARVLLRAGPSSAPTRHRAPAPTPRPKDPTMTQLTATTATVTDVGRVRPSNQDHVLASPLVVGVADGFGPRGEVASEVALEALARAFEGDPTISAAAACTAANLAVWERAEADTDQAEMGTTLTAASLADDGTLTVLHVGDSRAYLLRDGALRLLTRDHLLVADLVAAGDLAQADLAGHPQRFVLTRAVGIGSEVETDVLELAAHPGDRVVLCTDGIATELDDTTIAEVVTEHTDLDAAAAELVRRANASGGRDNSAVAIMDVA